jgi:parvulin-like peptidyl-prolyl isomerase
VWGFQPNTANELTRKASEMEVETIAEPMKYQYGWSVIKLLAKDAARAKTFEEAAPEVATAFQEKMSKDREQQWVNELRAKYPVQINTDVLAKAFSGPAKSE